MTALLISLIIISSVLLFSILVFLVIGKAMYDIIFKRRKNDENFALEENKEDKLKPSRMWFSKQKLEEFSIKSKDNLTLKGYLLDNNSNKIAILVHGYRGRYYSLTSQAKIFFDEGYDVFLTNNRAHDTSQGTHFSMGEKESEDLLLWIDYLLKKNKNYQIVLMGVSMGGHIAMLSASKIDKEHLKCLIVDCGYASLKDTLIDQCSLSMPQILAKCLIIILSMYVKIFHRFSLSSNSKDSLAKLEVPVLFIHGDNDETVKIENMKKYILLT